MGQTERMPKSWKVAILAVLVTLLCACGLSIPTDPNGTLDRVTGGNLRVGVSWNEPRTSWPPDQDEPTGVEPDLIREFAEHLGAGVTWQRGGEERLMDQLAEEDLDLVIGGLTSDTPWGSEAAITAVYDRSVGPEGKQQAHVMATIMGENAFLVELEQFLRHRETT